MHPRLRIAKLKDIGLAVLFELGAVLADLAGDATVCEVTQSSRHCLIAITEAEFSIFATEGAIQPFGECLAESRIPGKIGQVDRFEVIDEMLIALLNSDEVDLAMRAIELNNSEFSLYFARPHFRGEMRARPCLSVPMEQRAPHGRERTIGIQGTGQLG